MVGKGLQTEEQRQRNKDKFLVRNNASEKIEVKKMFKVWKDKNSLLESISSENVFQKQRWDKEFCTYIKSERIHTWQSYMTRKPFCYKKSYARQKYGSKEMTSTKRSRYITRYIRCFICIYISSKDISLLKQKW